MKTKLLALVGAVLIFSCSEDKTSGENQTENILEGLTYTVDTVMVDSGEELLNLQWGLRLAVLNEGKNKIFLLNEVNTTLAEIDLDALKLAEIHQLEKEGPNGIGEYISDLSVLGGDRFMISSFRSSGIFNTSGEKLTDLNFSPKEIEGIESDDDMPMTNGLTINAEGTKAFALPGNFFEGTRDLAVVDVASKTGKLIDIPAMDIAGDFRIVLKSDEMMSVYVEEIDITPISDKIYITTSVSSDIYRYDPKLDSLELFSFTPTLFPSVKSGTVKNEVSSQEEFESEMKKLSTQVGFEKLLWDEESSRFYRFARKYYPREDEEAPRKVDVFLMAFDKDLNLIGEIQLDELKSVPSYPFFKDGKLWSYVNVEDELGFAVFTFDF
ncbi:DUF4221 family protein [Algoriphagus namhaensis]